MISDDSLTKFRKLKTREDLASLLEIPHKKLSYLLYVQYGGQRDRYYHQFQITKRNGKLRDIEAPNSALLFVQNKLAKVLNDIAWNKPCSYAYQQKKSILDNARCHKKKNFVFNIDLQNFFQTITAKRIYGLLKARPYEIGSEAAATICQIVTYKGRLPTGAPTSPVLSNMICAKLDANLMKLATNHRCYYTRYADDLTFSTYSNKPVDALWSFDTDLNPFVSLPLQAIIEDNGFKINTEKTRLAHKTQRQIVTGLTVNRFPNVKRAYINQTRGMLHACRKYGLLAAAEHYFTHYAVNNSLEESTSRCFRSVIYGRIGYVGMIKGKNDSTYLKLKSMYTSTFSHPNSKLDFYYNELTDTKDCIFTEGCTDWKHLEKAFRLFRGAKEFLELDIDFFKYGQATPAGATHRLAAARHLSSFPRKKKILFVFDSDDDAINSEFVEDSLVKILGNNVYLIKIPSPSYRKSKICIEQLYPDSDLLRGDDEGRRIFISDEFDGKTGRHLTLENVRYGMHPAKGTLEKGWKKPLNAGFPKVLDCLVADTSEIPAKSLALSKSRFADSIYNNVQEFEGMDFSGFKPLFELIAEVLN